MRKKIDPTDDQQPFRNVSQLPWDRLMTANPSVTATKIIPIDSIGTVVDTIAAKPADRLQVNIVFDPLLQPATLKDQWTVDMANFHAREVPCELKVWKIHNCIVLPPHMIMLTPDGHVIAESIRKRTIITGNEHLSHLYDASQSNDPKPIAYGLNDKSAYILSSSQHWNYFHFMIETLPRSQWIELHSALDKVRLVSIPSKRFQDEAFDLIASGSTKRDLLASPTLFPEIYFMQSVARSNMRISPVVRDFYRSRVKSPPTRSRRIFVSRNDAGTRRITNESDFSGLLREKGFEIITPGRMSVREQMTAFSEAEVVAGSHGAGLANLVFCSRGTRVIEFIPSSFKEGITCYAALSELFELGYTMYLGEATQPSRGPSSDLHITIDSMMAVLEKAIAGA